MLNGLNSVIMKWNNGFVEAPISQRASDTLKNIAMGVRHNETNNQKKDIAVCRMRVSDMSGVWLPHGPDMQ